MRPIKADAIYSLAPTAEWYTQAGVLHWISTDVEQPTEEQIQVELVRLQAEYDNKQYQRNRAAEYPSIGDQLDALWKGGDAATEMLAKVQAVKNKYPKGTE